MDDVRGHHSGVAAHCRPFLAFIKDTLLLLFLFRLQILSQSFVSFSIYLRRIQFKYRSFRVLSLEKLPQLDLDCFIYLSVLLLLLVGCDSV